MTMPAPVHYGNRFSVYTSTDHRAALWVLTILSLLYSCLFLGVRLVVKRNFWGPDDIALGLSYVGQSARRARK